MTISSRLRRLVLFGFVVVAFAFTIAPTAFPQATNATLTGTIKDQTGAAIAGATVTATNTSTGIQKSGASNSDGYYTVVELVPGTYDIQATQKGFSTMVYRAQEILVGTTVTRDFAMQVSSISQVVEVTSNAAVIEPTQTSVERVLAPEVLNDLPTLNRSFSDLAVLAPGVQATGVNTSVTPGGTGRGAGLPTIGGSPTYESGFVADGITMEAGNQGGPYVTLSQDWVQEFSIIALQFPAEYGEAAGGVVNVSTRSGTNQIHGRVYGFFQNADLNANPEFYTGKTRAPFNSERGGGMLGGPIKKGKLFYFIGDEFFHQLSTAALPSGQTAGAFLTTAQPLTT